MKFLSLISLLGLAASNELEMQYQTTSLAAEEGLENVEEMLALFDDEDQEDELVAEDDLVAFNEEDLTDLASEAQLKTDDPRLTKLMKNVAKQTKEALNKIGAKIMKK